MKKTRPAWIEIDLSKFKKNLTTILIALPETTELMFVVKDEAYGTGARELVQVAWNEGIDKFATSNMEEALAVREVLPEAEILLLGYTTEEMLPVAVEKGIICNVWSLEMAEKLNTLGRRWGRIVPVEISIDTGLGRLGFLPNDLAKEEVIAISKLDYIQIRGIFSHFARTETEDDEFSLRQLDAFCSFTCELEAVGVDTGRHHISDSAAIVKFPEANLDMVRCGALMVGSMTGRHIVPEDETFTMLPLASLKCQIARVVQLPKGASVSYDDTYTADHDILVATLPIGYGDGLSKDLTNKMSVLVGGKRCPQIGALNMDMIMVDVTGVDCKQGDEAVLLGESGSEAITLDDWAHWGGKSPTFYYSCLRERIPHFYINTEEERNA